MPDSSGKFSSSDAARHKKGLNSSQRAKWAKIATSAFRNCQKMGKGDCEGSAIRIANSRVGRSRES